MALKSAGHFRKAILGVASYVAGKSLEELKREFPHLRRPLIKLASNENPIGPSPKALQAIREALSGLHRYPEPASWNLRHRLSEYLRVPPEQIIMGAGSDDLLRLMVETVLEQGERVILSRYAFMRFKQNTQIMGGCSVEVPMKQWTHDLEAMAQEASRGAKIVFIANPNNPTGTYNTEGQWNAFLAKLLTLPKSRRPWVVLDEAYHEFARHFYHDYPQSVPSGLQVYPRLIVLRTLSKSVGLAGLRVGYGVAGDKSLIALMNRARLPFNLSTLAQAGALAALEDAAHLQKTLQIVARERAWLMRRLKSLGFDVVHPGAANFLFTTVPAGAGWRLYQNLLREGIIIRPMLDPGLKRYVRITIGSRKDNQALVRALVKIYRERHA